MLDLALVEKLLSAEKKVITKVYSVAEVVEIEDVPITAGAPVVFVMDMGYQDFDDPNTDDTVTIEVPKFGVISGIRFVQRQNGNEQLRTVRKTVRNALRNKTIEADYTPIGLVGGRPLRVLEKKLFYLDMFKTSYIEMDEL